jgi:hypothetical protein
MAKDQSVRISIAEKKKLTLLFSFRLQDPVTVSPHNVVIGWQILAMPAMKTIAAATEAKMRNQMIYVNPFFVAAIRRSVIAMLDLIATALEA